MGVLLLAASASGCRTPAFEDPGDSGTAAIVHRHAHNDYEHSRPLLDALDHHFDSVEADVWLKGGEILVSHDGVRFKGALRELYLDPLQARAEGNAGSITGDGKPFFLWLDLKDGSAALQDALVALLSGYPMLSTFDDEKETKAAVTVILTGNDDAKRALTARPSPRRYTRDSNTLASSDPAADSRWGYYALNYGPHVYWDGTGEIPPAELKRLRALINTAHVKGRPIRFWATPETAEFWAVARDAGLDFVNTDELARLDAFFQAPP